MQRILGYCSNCGKDEFKTIVIEISTGGLRYKFCVKCYPEGLEQISRILRETYRED